MIQYSSINKDYNIILHKFANMERGKNLNESKKRENRF